MKIAIAGKGGVGKTTIMALIAKELQRAGKEVLIIDADPSPHMAQTLGFDNIDQITPIADMTALLADRAGKVEGSPFYNINPQVDDLLADFMVEKDGLPETPAARFCRRGDSSRAGHRCPRAEPRRKYPTRYGSGLRLQAFDFGHLHRSARACPDVIGLGPSLTARAPLRSANRLRRWILARSRERAAQKVLGLM